jgi:hypothetical protein
MSPFMSQSSRPFPRLALCAAMAGTAILLGGCLIPEKFGASVDVKPDGSATYQYDGTAKHFLAAAEIQKKGQLSAKDEASLAAEAQKDAKSPGVKKFEYLGAGRYQIVATQELQAGGKPALLDVVRLTKSKEGVYALTSSELKESDKRQLKELNISMDGTMEVRLPANAKVVSHNASGTPGLFSKAYSWKIGGIDSKPSITYTLSPS